MSTDLQKLIIEELKELNRKIERVEDRMFSLQVKVFAGIVATLVSIIIALVRYS